VLRCTHDEAGHVLHTATRRTFDRGVLHAIQRLIIMDYYFGSFDLQLAWLRPEILHNLVKCIVVFIAIYWVIHEVGLGVEFLRFEF
jgi:hypothetical protein